MSEAEIPVQVEKIKSAIRVLALALPVAAESGKKGVAATQIASEIKLIVSLLSTIEPSWRSGLHYATFGTAVDYYKSLEASAAQVHADLQQSNSTVL